MGGHVLIVGCGTFKAAIFLPPQLTKEVGSIAPFLFPFLKMCCIYFILDLPEEDPSATAAFIKALPVLSLTWLVCLQGVFHGDVPNHFITYNRRILMGLLFSIVGDILLVWQMYELYFLLGMLSFACAQICYISAFGFVSFGLKEFIPSLVGVGAVIAILYPCVPSGPLVYMVPIYSLLVATMAWRSLACFSFNNGIIPWRKIFSAIGAILFVISDTCIAFNKFCFPVPFERPVIMITYYAAQLCLSLSVINAQLYRPQANAPSKNPFSSTKTPPPCCVQGS